MDPWISEELEIVRPGLIDALVLTQQPDHRSTDIWHGEMKYLDSRPLDCRGCFKEMAKISMLDNRVIDIIKLVGLEGLYRAPSREIDHGLISALVE
ncbi:hypothetical protein SO802_021305 [Lithocarpus litseifolius]|uniref:Uncharacterized protein n=1 Tax=Lithocarpus litseifolius TaxID=425828 RepID=A0AAW2CIQ1_9ROSI